MVEFVAADMTEVDRGDQFFNIGVLLEIDGGSEFDNSYFSTTEAICDDYNIDTQHPVLKSNHLKKQTPSYSIPEARSRLVKGILGNPALRHIHINIGYYQENINPPWYSGSKPGSEFVKGWMAQLFEVITIWRYSENRYDDKTPQDAWTDDISGKISPCWNYVNNHFDLSITPHGDKTYPSLASADAIAGYLSSTLPNNKDLDELSDACYGILMADAEDAGVDINLWAETVNSDRSEKIVPHHPYQIGGALHYPHPMLFIYSEDFDTSPGKILPGTDFYSHARRWAYNNRGAFKIMQEHEFSNHVRSGDTIAYTSEETPNLCKTLQRLNQNKDIDLLSADELAESADGN